MDVGNILYAIEMMYRNTEIVDESDIINTKIHIESKYGKFCDMYPNMNSLGAVKAICLFKPHQTPFMKYILNYSGSDIL